MITRRRKPFERCSRCYMSGGANFGHCACTDGGIVEVPELGGFSEYDPNPLLERHDVDGRDNPDCTACNGLPSTDERFTRVVK